MTDEKMERKSSKDTDFTASTAMAASNLSSYERSRAYNKETFRYEVVPNI